MGTVRLGLIAGTLLLVVAACGGTSEEVSSTSPTIVVDSTVEEGTLGTPDDTVDSVELTAVPGAASSTSTTSPEEPDPGAPLPTLPDPKVPRGLEPVVAQARSDLAARLGATESAITVAVTETIVWPDASLGCPQVGVEYAQVQVEGWRVVFTHGGSTYSYHGGGAQPDGFLCRNPSFPSG